MATLPTEAKVTYSVTHLGKEYSKTIKLTDLKLGSSTPKTTVYSKVLELLELQVVKELKDNI